MPSPAFSRWRPIETIRPSTRTEPVNTARSAPGSFTRRCQPRLECQRYTPSASVCAAGRPSTDEGHGPVGQVEAPAAPSVTGTSARVAVVSRAPAAAARRSGWSVSIGPPGVGVAGWRPPNPRGRTFGKHRANVRSSSSPPQHVTTSRIHHVRIAISARNAWEHHDMDKGTILVVEDEPNIADLVDLYLSRDGFRVVKKATGEDGLAAIRDQQPRLVVLDVGLPDVDGLEVCRRIRATSALPVIFLTARADEVDRILGLELGADDYLTKPFAPAELVARVKAVLRRTDGVPGSALIQVGGVVVDLGRREIRVHDTPVDFTTKEFELLRFLAERPGLAMSRHQILDAVWGHGWYGDERTVDVHIAQVRKKVGDACVIATVRGVGYRLEPAGAG